jgi:hypothetical protein
MKKLITLLTGLMLLLIVSQAQDIVVTTPQLKNIILEEYTGLNCPYCPYGHQEAEAIYDNYPNRTAIINVHTGYYSQPSEGQPDFRTEWGAALASEASVAGYPAGSVNRHYFPDIADGSGSAMGRDKWASAAAIIKDESSYMNVGFESQYNSSTREVTVNVEVYYVEDAPFMVDNNYINIAVTENQVYGYQANGGDNYEHNHILRDLVTGQWGDEIATPEAGDLISRSYTYTLPSEYDASNCDITVFVAEGHSEIITGGVSELDGGSHNGETQLDFGRLNTDDFIAGGTAGNTSGLPATFLVGDTAIATYDISFSNNQPAGWNAEYSINGNTFTGNTSMQLDPGTSYPINFNVTPNENNGIGWYQLEISSSNYPGADPKSISFYVSKGVKHLVVNGSGTFTGISADDYQDEYLESLTQAGTTETGAVSALAMAEGFNKGIFDEVRNIFFNVSYTHPTMSDDQISALETFIDNGGNLLIAGQDIGWDAMASSGYGSLALVNFYSNYLRAIYTNDGDSEGVESIDEEGLLGDLGSQSLLSLYGSPAPDKIYPDSDAVSILSYTDDMASAGLRTTIGEAKIVYLAFGLEQLASDSYRDSIMARTYRWFEGLDNLGSVENNTNKHISLYPNPVEDYCLVQAEINNGKRINLSLFNSQGACITKKSVTWENRYKLNTEHLPPGIYFIRLSADNKHWHKKFVKK